VPETTRTLFHRASRVLPNFASPAGLAGTGPRVALGVALGVGLVAGIEILGRPQGLEPVALVTVLVLAATVVGGYVSGGIVASIGIGYAALYYLALSGAGGGVVRVALTAAGAVAAVALTGALQRRVERSRASEANHRALASRVQEFTTIVANEPPETMPEAIVQGTARLLGIDMCVLTLLDPQTGRHFVRAARGGGGGSAVGVEVIPGVGVTGQALRERRPVLAIPTSRGRGATAVAAVPALQGGRVIAILTIGRADASGAFGADDVAALDLVAPIVTLAVSGSLQRQEMEQGSPRDAQTGLYTRAYLDAALEQLLALRRRSAPTERPPLSMIMFDIDSFPLLSERHGRQVADTALRAVATLLRQRFRASDILARTGPTSFFAVLNGANAEVAAEAAAHVRRQVRELNLTNSRGEPVVISISAGCSMFHDGDRPETLFRSVEAALETARWSGPGAVVSI
jgi:diguanylate cyclase (GGDEF)-like protein